MAAVITLPSPGASDDQPTVSERHQFSAADSVRTLELASRFPSGVIPVWAVRQESPNEWGSPGDSHPSLPDMAETCTSLVDFEVTQDRLDPSFDSVARATDFYIADVLGEQVIRHRFDSLLNYEYDTIAQNMGVVWVSEDLDNDGHIDLVTQFFDQLFIYSAPDWNLRASFHWPGFAVAMHAATFQVDDDEYHELLVAPNALSGDAFVVVIQYDVPNDTFTVQSELYVSTSDGMPPDGAIGQAAIGDFDADGRVEFILGNLACCHELFEWQDTGLAYIGTVGDSIPATAQVASSIACRPLPDQKLRPLLGSSSHDTSYGYNYRLMTAVGDNNFELTHWFRHNTGYIGIHPCWAADTDCDGLQELAMASYPEWRVWEWDQYTEQFVEGCFWQLPLNRSLSRWKSADLNQDGRDEWIVVDNLLQLYVFEDNDCVNCNTSGICPPDPSCPCFCHADPICNGNTDVFDVVASVDVAFRSVQPGPTSELSARADGCRL
jgi:hypothetical protein